MGPNETKYLTSEPLDNNREFARRLHAARLKGCALNFNKMEKGSVERISDPDMTLDRFLNIMTQNSMVALQTQEQTSSMRFAVCFTYDPNNPGTERFLFYNCDYDYTTRGRISNLFSKVYGKPF